ncbi:deoxynucleotide monophosphate kinase [Mesorhizobium sp. M7A.F.Ca.CA.004.02.1.1]|uniref:deoxynucleotide monophosphate kinase family protein n=1 Tax=Mesorhizobium sp. M7A.F.Ca.CA.004.02.1.1 TaxID=2496690 RepID=UPI000FCA0384|nr:deoxynucleotide monophosphate kinase [Mesorhizobium sp. M7A.F.Ca.CA.004.02.1.1]RVB02856.1 deoxynucleotide monophosphate kinase [Mesorhizobium sp. M7A.F.Ca.CA.004.02.1.1]
MASKVIALSGPAGSGKSEAGRYLVDAHGYQSVKFAGPLKNMLRAFYHSVGLEDLDQIERRIEGDLKEEPCKYLNGATPRYAMQTLGSEWGRQLMSDDFWIRSWERKVDSIEGPVVTDDCRFENEAETVMAAGGEVVRLHPKVFRRGTSSHASECGISSDWVNHVVTNDGSIADLQDKMLEIIEPMHVVTFGTLGSE